MQYKKKIFFISLLLISALSTSRLWAQDDDILGPRHARVVLAAATYGDSVVLRLGISKSAAWLIGNKKGYIIERVRSNDKGEFDRMKYEQLTPSPLKPWTEEKWKSQLSKKPDSTSWYSAIAMQMIYGKTRVPKAQSSKDITPMIRKTQELEDRFGFALFAADIDPVAAEASGLRYADHSVHVGDSYIYRAYIPNSDTSYHIDTAYLVVRVTLREALTPPPGFIADTGDGTIRLRWQYMEQGYEAYHISRSDDGGKSYHRLNSTPILVMKASKSKGLPFPSFTDTGVTNYRKYFYRLQGITPFGEVSEPAEIEASSMDLTPPPSPIPDDPVQIGTNKVKLTWIERNPPNDLKGFLVARSGKSLGGFHIISEKPIAPGINTFIDENATEMEPYYVIGALDNAGNIGRSIVIAADVIDSAPPSPPTGVIGTMDTNGIVHLRWNLGSEKNLIGYRVLWANDIKHDFTQRTPNNITDTNFIDTMPVKTQTRYVYYRVSAVNIRQNQSEMSVVCPVQRPDLVPPTPSIFKDIQCTDSSVILSWARSESEDLRSQNLYRRKVSSDNIHTDNWEEIKRLNNLSEQYEDTKVKLNTTYQYQLITIDSSGNRSTPSPIVQGRPYDIGRREAVTNVAISYDSTKKTAHLSWKYSGKNEDYFFIIYRSVDGRAIAQYKAVKKNELSFDEPLVYNGNYSYAVKVHANIGAESPLSEQVSVERK